MSTGVDCAVYIAGERVADGHIGDDPLAPTVLSGLSITWGRDTTVDQPAPSSLQFQLMDEPGGSSFLDTLRTGQRVDVTSTGTIYSDPTTSTIVDPGFAETPIGQTPGNVRASNGAATVRAPGGRSALRMLPADATHAHQVLIAPAPFSPSPAAWDAIPPTSGGQTWQMEIDVFAPVGAAVTVQPVLIFDPAGNRVEPVGDTMSATGTGGWETLATAVTPGVAAAWMGFLVRVFPTGPRWADRSGSWAQAVGTWQDLAAVYLDDVRALAPASSIPRTVLVYSGRVTDLELGYDDTVDLPVVAVTAQDFTADMANIRVGDEPWPVEPMGDRFERVVALTGVDVTTIIDDPVAAVPLSYQDVDSQPAAGLLQDFAQSVDAVMWSATHQTTGPYLHVEDPASRPPMSQLAEQDGEVVIVASTIAEAQRISACDMLRDPVRWAQSVADVATRASVTWLEQGVDDEGQPETTERTVTLVEPELEAEYGQRSISVSTLLAAADDAENVARRILARSVFTGWRASGLTIDDDESLERVDNVAVAMLLRLLDGTSRNGMPILLTDLPDWSPFGAELPVYLEGGTYTHNDGTWTLALTVSDGAGQGRSATWGDLDDDWAWDDLDPEISWLDLIGVGVQTAMQGAP